jgi:hypothetical protein
LAQWKFCQSQRLTQPPDLPTDAGRGKSVVILGAGIAGMSNRLTMPSIESSLKQKQPDFEYVALKSNSEKLQWRKGTKNYALSVFERLVQNN